MEDSFTTEGLLRAHNNSLIARQDWSHPPTLEQIKSVSKQFFPMVRNGLFLLELDARVTKLSERTSLRVEYLKHQRECLDFQARFKEERIFARVVAAHVFGVKVGLRIQPADLAHAEIVERMLLLPWKDVPQAPDDYARACETLTFSMEAVTRFVTSSVFNESTNETSTLITQRGVERHFQNSTLFCGWLRDAISRIEEQDAPFLALHASGEVERAIAESPGATKSIVADPTEEIEEAAEKESGADPTAQEIADNLRDRGRELIQAMGNAGLMDGNRWTQEEIKLSAGYPAENCERSFIALRKLGLITTVSGPGGGTQLTPLGKAVYSAMMKPPGIPGAG